MSSLLHAPKPSIDAVTTIRDDGSRCFLHPADVSGRFTRWRRASGAVLIAVYLSLPWIKVAGYPAVFLDVGSRRFHLFGLTLAFHDIWLLFFAISGLGFGLFFVTALLGRVWCGWACPQTVFLDHVYRRIERWIDGDAPSRRALENAPWSANKLVRRVAKQTAYVLVSAVIAHLLLAYFVSIPELWTMLRHDPGQHWSAFVFVSALTGMLYFNYAWFREQLCIVICPYGRMQSALTDDHTLNIGYDARRGEPRGKKAVRTTDAPPMGDCVDCTRCVQVCPTGIDIRQGLQLECIGCAACIDACDTVMSRLNRPTGLIRYDSQRGFEGSRTRWFRPRMIVYTALMLLGVAATIFASLTVRPANLSVNRMAGAPYFVSPEAVRNQFLVRVENKRDIPQRLRLSVVGGPDELSQSGLTDVFEVPAMAEIVTPLVLQLPRPAFQGHLALMVEVKEEAGSYVLRRRLEFVGPDPVLLRQQEAEWKTEADEKLK